MTETAGILGGRTIPMFSPSRARLDEVGAWFASEYPALLRFAYFAGGDRDLAQDLVQEAFVRVYRAGGRVDQATIGAYARRAIANLARSGFRRRAVAARNAAHVPGSAQQPDVDTHDEVWRAILRLSAKQRAVVALRYYEDYSERDIAATLRMSAGAVKKHSDRAMTKLRETLGRES